jgi:hypothetical protein
MFWGNYNSLISPACLGICFIKTGQAGRGNGPTSRSKNWSALHCIEREKVSCHIVVFLWLLRRQLMTDTITSSPTKLLLTNRFYFQQTFGIHGPVGKRKSCSLSGRSHAPIADSFHVATMARKHSVLNL